MKKLIVIIVLTVATLVSTSMWVITQIDLNAIQEINTECDHTHCEEVIQTFKHNFEIRTESMIDLVKPHIPEIERFINSEFDYEYEL